MQKKLLVTMYEKEEGNSVGKIVASKDCTIEGGDKNFINVVYQREPGNPESLTITTLVVSDRAAGVDLYEGVDGIAEPIGTIKFDPIIGGTND